MFFIYTEVERISFDRAGHATITLKELQRDEERSFETELDAREPNNDGVCPTCNGNRLVRIKLIGGWTFDRCPTCQGV